MAKTIKFNLLLDDNPVRDIKGLQNNFCIDDILEVYENGLLQKWLKVRGFDEYLEQVENIKKNTSVIVQLIKIFDIQKDDIEIKKSIYSLEFQENRKKSLENFNTKDTDLKHIIEEYHKEYEELIEDIIEHKENMEFLKVASKEISDKYQKLFELDYKDSYELYKEKSPFMIYAILMNDKLSGFFLNNEKIKESLYKNFILESKAKTIKCSKCDGKINPIDNIDNNVNIATVGAIALMLGEQRVEKKCTTCNGKGNIEVLKEDNRFNNIIEKFKGETDSYWKDLETSDTKVMILSIPNNTYIRSANDSKKELSAKDVNGNFLILDGLAYKSNINTKSIVYIKV